MRALLTAGGTSEAVDDVRVLTNVSSGRFGAALANTLVTRGVHVDLLASRSLASHPDWIDPRVRVVPFGSFADLSAALETETLAAPDLLLMAAAVSDYSPTPSAGKIRSDRDELVLTLRRNPKLIAGLRARCGPSTRIVGFKLLSGVPEHVLIETARQMLVSNGLDATVANDLADLRGGGHRASLVWADRVDGPFAGSKRDVAGAICDRLVPSEPPDDPLDAKDAPDGGAVIRTRCALVLPTATLARPVRPATPEENAAINAALSGAAWRGRWRGGAASVDLGEGRSWIRVDSAVGLHRDWLLLVDGATTACREQGVPESGLRRTRWVPIFDGGTLVGAAAELEVDGLSAWAPWLLPIERGAGRGDRIVRAMSAAGRFAFCTARSGLEAGYVERGWLPSPPVDDLIVLTPPSRRADFVAAASMTLLDPVRRRVLIGERATPPWLGYWAFPGGRAEPGESSFECAVRELAEETGIVLGAATPVRERTVHVGSGDGRRCFSVTNFLVPVIHAPEPRATPELRARWVPIAEASELRPIAAGTRSLLRQIGPEVLDG